MDASTRWETEALRGGKSTRPAPPRPSRKRDATTRTWLTLKEAEAATGIPTNTLRKWVRKSELASYLESDGEHAVRMVDLGAVERRARELGRDIGPIETGEANTRPGIPERKPEEPATEMVDEIRQDATSAETMIVPVDAWNKMLLQLGNLHEAGQQLAEARERAAKAETEAVFLRERLAELRMQPDQQPVAAAEERTQGAPSDDDSGGDDAEDERRHAGGTTAYWRYLTTGWRHRRRRRTD